MESMRPTLSLLLLAALASPAAAQDPPSLRDLFTTTTVSLEAPARMDDPAALDAYLAALAERIAARDPEPAIRGTERVISFLDQRDPRWAEAVWLRAAANELRGDDAAVEELCRAYLNAAPEGPRAAWAHERLAMTAARRFDWATSANAWREALRLGPKPPDGDLLTRAVEALGRANRPRDLREAAALGSNAALTQTQADIIEYWYLDSLLAEDDPDVAIPAERPGMPAATALRRALLLELRQQHEEAAGAYLALRERTAELTPEENELLRARGPRTR
jgi:hypothetical protein